MPTDVNHMDDPGTRDKLKAMLAAKEEKMNNQDGEGDPTLWLRLLKDSAAGGISSRKKYNVVPIED